jgi:hypothetical protein
VFPVHGLSKIIYFSRAAWIGRLGGWVLNPGTGAKTQARNGHRHSQTTNTITTTHARTTPGVSRSNHKISDYLRLEKPTPRL